MKKKSIKERVFSLFSKKEEAPKKRPRKRKMERIQSIAKDPIKEEPQRTIEPPKKICTTYEEHNCMAIQLTNRVITMLEDFEANIKKIENHPGLPDNTKCDIQNYINKNIVTVLWALSPAFPLMLKHPRYKTFSYLYKDAMKRAVPGILEEIKHI